jgi:hypothetical protein
VHIIYFWRVFVKSVGEPPHHICAAPGKKFDALLASTIVQYRKHSNIFWGGKNFGIVSIGTGTGTGTCFSSGAKVKQLCL